MKQEGKVISIEKKDVTKYILSINLSFGYTHEIFGEFYKMKVEFENISSLMIEKSEDFIIISYQDGCVGLYIKDIISIELNKAN